MEMRGLTLSFILLVSSAVFGQTSPVVESEAASAQKLNATALNPAPISFSREQIQEMIRLSAEKDMENDKRQRDYTYVEREEQHKLNGKGEVSSSETHTYEVMQIYNEQVRRLTAKDDKPLSDEGCGQGRGEDPEDPRQAQERVGLAAREAA